MGLTDISYLLSYGKEWVEGCTCILEYKTDLLPPKLSEFPIAAVVKPSASILITAKSVILSPPTRLASYVLPSGKLTIISFAPRTTWKLVTI